MILRVRLTPEEHARLVVLVGPGGLSAYVRAQLGLYDYA